MDRLRFDDVELACTMEGHGDPVLLAHATAFVSWYDPLVARLPQFRLIRCRRTFDPDRHAVDVPGFTVADDADLWRRLLDHLEIEQAHAVGHSYGALVAMLLAVHAPERIRTVVLLEPAVRGVASSEQVVAALRPIVAAYRSGDVEGALDGFLRTVCGDDYLPDLERALPDARAEALAHADTFFQVEMPAVQAFGFGPEQAARVVQPVLNVIGERTAPRFVEGQQVVQTWFPHAERCTLRGASHLLMVQEPQAMADTLAAFFGRHPITAGAAGS
jgi:pimeloyl-ACP methyl ester carboxylesterase